jgi:hypothetical protein
MIDPEWYYPTQSSIDMLEACMYPASSEFWKDWYAERVETLKTMRDWGLAYAE